MTTPLPWNPLFDRWAHHNPRGPRGFWELADGDNILDMMRARWTATRDYAFAVPTPEAIAAIMAAAPRLVELGAGTGYWAKLLADAGADILAFDVVPAGTANAYAARDWDAPAPATPNASLPAHEGQRIGRWFSVAVGDAASLAAHHDRALLLVWPPMDAMAVEALTVWRGDVLVYVGEWGGCNADDAFFERLEAEFDEVASLGLPQWEGLHDELWVFRRRVFPQ